MSGWLGWSGRFLADFDPAYPIQANFSEISARCARRQIFNQILRNTDLGQATSPVASATLWPSGTERHGGGREPMTEDAVFTAQETHRRPTADQY